MGGVLIPLVLSLCAGAGVFLLVDASAGERRVRTRGFRQGAATRLRDWLTQAGLEEVRPLEFVSVAVACGALAATTGLALFGGAAAPAVLGVFACTFPLAAHRKRRRQRREIAMESWPRLIDEIRVLTCSAGRSIPQALFETGVGAPVELRPAFEEAHREWLLTTDFERTLTVLKDRLADPTADAACETLLVAHEVGGVDLERRLEALADDRRLEVQGRKDARAKLAGVRFARRFVLLVPLGMALAGMAIGTGRAAYGTPLGQALVIAAIGMVVACWAWSGQLMQLPEQRRVFRS